MLRIAARNGTRLLSLMSRGMTANSATNTNGVAAAKNAATAPLSSAWQTNFKKCDPYEQGGKPLPLEEVRKYRERDIPSWDLDEQGTTLSKTWQATNFVHAGEFVKRVAILVENVGHFPSIKIHDYNQVTVTLHTVALGGLSYLDFIMALKIEYLSRSIQNLKNKKE